MAEQIFEPQRAGADAALGAPHRPKRLVHSPMLERGKFQDGQSRAEVVHVSELVGDVHMDVQDCERAAGVGIDRKLPDEFAAWSELDQFTGLGRIHMSGGIRIRGYKVAIGSDHQPQRPVQMLVVRVDQRSFACGAGQRAGGMNRKNRVVIFGGDVKGYPSWGCKPAPPDRPPTQRYRDQICNRRRS